MRTEEEIRYQIDVCSHTIKTFDDAPIGSMAHKQLIKAKCERRALIWVLGEDE